MDDYADKITVIVSRHINTITYCDKKYILDYLSEGGTKYFSEDDILHLMDVVKINTPTERYNMIKDYIGYLNDNGFTENKTRNDHVNEIDVIRFFEEQDIKKTPKQIARDFMGLFNGRTEMGSEAKMTFVDDYLKLACGCDESKYNEILKEIKKLNISNRRSDGCKIS